MSVYLLTYLLTYHSLPLSLPLPSPPHAFSSTPFKREINRCHTVFKLGGNVRAMKYLVSITNVRVWVVQSVPAE